MKTTYKLYLIKILSVILLISFTNIFLAGCAASEYQSSNYSSVPRSYNLEVLNNYGQWIQLQQYGFVWKPSVVAGWEPFHYGHWIYSDNEWTWVSYEPYGWLVYHYGEWFDDSKYGWVWVPENNGWSPANVQWRQYGEYISWSPLPPRGINYGNPWEENESRHWHTAKSDQFQKDNIGQFKEEHPLLRNTGGERGINNQSMTNNNIPSVQRNNGQKGNNDIIINGFKVFPSAPATKDIEKKTGEKIITVPITKEKIKVMENNLTKMGLPESEQKRVQPHEQNVQRNIIVPRPNRDQQQEKKEINKEERKNRI